MQSDQVAAYSLGQDKRKADVMRNTTPEECEAAVLLMGIVTIKHHRCGGCDCWVSWLVRDGALFFDSGCGCCRLGPPDPREWQDLSDWINMQDDPAIKATTARRCGVELIKPPVEPINPDAEDVVKEPT